MTFTQKVLKAHLSKRLKRRGIFKHILRFPYYYAKYYHPKILNQFRIYVWYPRLTYQFGTEMLEYEQRFV